MSVRTDAGHLPAEADEFVGRERDVAEVGALLTRTRLLTLSGPGGIGKSRLALRIAALTAGGAAPPPVYFAEMADLDADELVAPRVAAAIGVTAEPGRSVGDTLLDVARARPMLLVLDNCEHLVDECARLCTALLSVGGDGLRLLATSREPLRVPGEAVWRVPPMALTVADPDGPESSGAGASEAARLFVARATAARPDFPDSPGARAEIDRLCRALDGMPLAIELAAARVRVLSVAQIAARLDDRFRLLASGDRTAPPRQRTLRAAMDWSHALLGEPERVLFRRLAVFSGGWTLDMAEAVCADAGDGMPLSEVEVLDRLADLVDKSLVTVAGEVAGEMRYRMLESVRQYAAVHLDEAGERDELRDRHLAYMAAFTDRAHDAALGPHPAPWPEVLQIMHRTAVEQGNCWAAMTWALRTGDLAPGLAICRAMVRGWWVPQGEFEVGATWCERFLDATEGTTSAGRARVLVGRAEIAFERTDLATAGEYARLGLAASRETGEDHSGVSALNILAANDLYQGDADGAATHLAEALDLARATGDRWDLVLGLSVDATAALFGGDHDRARARFEEAAEVARDVGNNWLIGRTLLGMGAVASASGDRTRATRLYEEALVLLREDEARTETVRCLVFLARIAIDDEAFALAGDRLREALRLSEQVGHWRAVTRCLESAAVLAERQGAYEDAGLLGGAAGRLRADLGAPPPSGGSGAGLRERLAAECGEAAVAQWWERGQELSRAEAVDRAVRARPSVPAQAPPPDDGGVALPGGPGGPLTAREVQIAGLLARGLSNREVAAELVISQATVARHVANILTKLGFSSRAQVAAWFVRHGVDGAGNGAVP
ncbi:MAG TPA: LuxR C-terminal-related transcriptional regulator [Streptosporangiaceae bacterium]|jgi:predicted ATPase/DNA-binding CsgD family transcriptional regulator